MNTNVAERIVNKQETLAPTDNTGVTQPLVFETTVAESDILANRLETTKSWLNSTADTNYSIQLFMARTSDADKVEAFLQDAPVMLDFTKIYIYETVINGRAWYSVLYNDFATQDSAINKLDELPSSLKASDPYLRRVAALKKDLARNK